ncbi:radical SAM protein [Beijerinckia indica]|nr:radical SAM protein [Beijerinckia indica]
MTHSLPVDDLRERALSQMRSPYEMKIICIDITNKCDLACSNCTRLLENQDMHWEMTLENFRLAVRSLADYPGIVAIIGGNPVMHRNFTEICEIFVEELPRKEQRGLWTNNVFKHSELAKEVFGIFNLNPHGVERGIKSLADLKDLGWYHEGHSSHSPLLTAGKDLFDEEDMWERIAHCDVNQDWSASIVQNNGQLRAYFCEVAASFDLARGTDHGIEPVPGWWRRSVSDFKDQVAHFCPGCGVPARLEGSMDFEKVDTYTSSNADLALKSLKKNRKIIELTSDQISKGIDHKVTQYSKNLRGIVDTKPTLMDRIRSMFGY